MLRYMGKHSLYQALTNCWTANDHQGHIHMMNKKAYSLLFDANLYSTSKEVEEAITFLEREIRGLSSILKLKLPPRHLASFTSIPDIQYTTIKRWQPKYTDHLRLVVLNLYNAYTHHQDMSISYWRAKGGYSPNRCQAVRLLLESMLLIVDSLGLMNLGYLDDSHLGSKKKHELSRMKGMPKLFDLLVNRFKLTPAMIQRHPNEELVVLKDTVKIEWKTKKDGSREKVKKTINVEYTETANTSRMRQNLRKINSLISKHFIGLCLNDEDVKKIQASRHESRKERIDFSKTSLHRSFSNRDFNQGGRLYGGWWQNIPSKFRKYTWIDNRMTYEFDFKCYQAKLLYAEAGLPIPPGDLYMVPGFPKEARLFLKEAFQVMMNTPSKRSAELKITSLLMEHSTLQGQYTARDITGTILKEHGAIRGQFFTGNKGLLLQSVDADITEEILLRLLDQDTVCLPIHDSFIVRRDHIRTLVDTMKSVIFDRYGYHIEMEQDDTAFDSYLDVWPLDDGEEIGVGFYEKHLVDKDLCSQYFSRLKAWEDLHGPCP
jgi:hypothetical protein